MSLYPWVNKNGEYPLGHPEIISQPSHTDLFRYFSLAKCMVLPPHSLFHPMLPYHHAGKVTFSPCASCVTEEMSKPFLEHTPVCTYTDLERQLVGTWCTPELLKGIEKIEKNPGLRTLAKMMLNSIWGKFGQRTNKTQVWEFDDPQKFSTFCNSDTLQIKYVGVQSHDRVEVQYTLQEEDESISPNLNIFVVCFTTCWARLKLYDALDILQERVLYKDTDSVVFLSAQGMPEPPLGGYLGDFKDKLPPDDYIVEFASGGPKKLWVQDPQR